MKGASQSLRANYDKLLTLQQKLTRLICTVENFKFSEPKVDFWNDIDHIFFDLDHTLCRYNFDALNQNIWCCWLDYLVSEQNYSPQILQWQLDPDFLQRGIFFDKREGAFIKLNNRCLVVKAYL